ncbi:MAG TPA: glycoside hydrolase, partial [Roseiflexaceae bacterium]|nr:glycoside hydrolase [Roseiflexaceae bacterium]
MDHILLSGMWDFRLDHETVWRPIGVPGCWEQIGVRKDLSGPAWYRTSFSVPAEWAGRRIWLRFDAVSYHCEVFVNGQALASHTGLWDRFEVEITGAAIPGAAAELTARIEKPAGLTAGPDSAALPGRFPLRETLSGFLPYVWGHIFG